MQNCIVVSFYGPKECIGACEVALAKKGYKVTDFPLFRWAHDVHDKKENYMQMLKDKVKEVDPKFILWIFTRIPPKRVTTFCKRIAKDVRHYFFNWDDPWCWFDPDNDIRIKAGCFDIVFPTCEDSCKKYIEHGSKDAKWLLPGFDPDNYKMLPSEPKTCDVVFCCTNMYIHQSKFGSELYKRKQLCDELEAADDICFHLYGPEHLRESFPKSYQGYAKYEDQSRIYNSAKICLSHHLVSNQSGYFNERTITILGSGGFLLIDPVRGIEKTFVNNKHCVYMDIDDPLGQIRKLLRNPGFLKRISKAGNDLALQKYTWDSWADTIHSAHCELLFDHSYYRTYLEDVNRPLEHPTDERLLTYWRSVGYPKFKDLPFGLDIPEEFDWKSYVDENGFEEHEMPKNRVEAWIHWTTEGKEEGLMYTTKKKV